MPLLPRALPFDRTGGRARADLNPLPPLLFRLGDADVEHAVVVAGLDLVLRDTGGQRDAARERPEAPLPAVRQVEGEDELVLGLGDVDGGEPARASDCQVWPASASASTLRSAKAFVGACAIQPSPFAALRPLLLNIT
jgi:hypothetical protein